LDESSVPHTTHSRTPLLTIYEVLRRSVGSEGVDGRAVQKALGLRSLYLAERLLAALSGTQRHFRTPQEFIDAAQELMAAPPHEKLEFLFRLHDADDDGWIRPRELERMFHLSAAEHELMLTDAEFDQLVQAVMEAGDGDRDGRIDVHEFVTMIGSQPEMYRRLSDYGVSLLMPGARARRRNQLPGANFRGWVRNEVVLALWVVAYGLACTGLFADAVLSHRALGAHPYIQFARGFGACLNFNAALLVVPMLRQTLTRVRLSVLGRVVPVDDAVMLHGRLGELTCAFAMAHSGAHVLNILRTSVNPWLPSYLSGYVLLASMLVIWIGSREFVRRSRRFELFYLSHLTYFVMVAVLFVHSKQFWIWGALPWGWFLVERSLRSRRRRERTHLLAATLYNCGVTRLDLARPWSFAYNPGDYVFLRLPQVARHEWHPFTLTSAPEQPEVLSVHIRTVGDWTRTVRERMPALLRHGEAARVQIDGPYGTPSRHILDVPHAVAIAGGIGVTPFAPIMKSLLLRQSDDTLSRPQLKKLRFVWLNRDQRAFEWFRDLLERLERADTRKLLEIHTFMTSGRSELAGGMLDFARYVLHMRARGDLITGLQSQTSLGYPDFDRLLETFYRSPTLPPPEVFFCGPARLERVVAKSCRRLGLRLRCERF
jgi:predicted ferric reductase/Ca2+-binding EF-hand superfamily protein